MSSLFEMSRSEYFARMWSRYVSVVQFIEVDSEQSAVVHESGRDGSDSTPNSSFGPTI